MQPQRAIRATTIVELAKPFAKGKATSLAQEVARVVRGWFEVTLYQAIAGSWQFRSAGKSLELVEAVASPYALTSSVLSGRLQQERGVKEELRKFFGQPAKEPKRILEGLPT